MASSFIEINALVAIHIFGWERRQYEKSNGETVEIIAPKDAPGHWYGPPLPYATHLALIEKLIKHMAEKHGFAMSIDHSLINGQWEFHVTFVGKRGCTGFAAGNRLAAVACEAALRALGVGDGT